MSEVAVRFNKPCGEQMRWIQLDWTPSEYTRPGQFIKATIGDRKPGFFAIASNPGQPIELLIKNSGEAAEALCAAQAGDMVTVTPPMGNGFPVERSDNREWVVLLNGSAISAVRPVLNAAVASNTDRKITVLYGVKTPAHRAFLADLEWWANAGIEIHTVCDQGDEAGWYGATGFVQDVANTMGLVRDDVSVILCGFPAMIEAAKTLYIAANCPEDQLLTNY